MSYRDRMARASFRGVSFEAFEISQTGGRVVAEHVYPGQERGLVEDMGRQLRRWSVRGAVVGPDYDRDAEALIAAVETPGAGVFLHPRHGRFVCQVAGYELAESSSDDGQASVSFDLVEAGERVFPVEVAAALPTADAVTASTGSAFLAALDAIADAAGWVSDSVLAAARDAVFIAGAAMLSRSVLAQAPSGAAWDGTWESMAGVVDAVIGLSTSVASLEAVVSAFSDDLATTATSPDALADLAGRQAIQRIWRRSALAAASESAIATEWATRDEALATRDRLEDAITSEIERGDDLDSDAIGAWQDLLSALDAAITDAADDLPELLTVDVDGVISALELAQRLYGDGSREDEIVRLNAIGNPGFIAGSVRVLSR